MKVLVLSCGRTGTNITVEALMGSSNLVSTQREERLLFKNPRRLPDKYLEKSDTVYIPNIKLIKNVLSLNPGLKIIWTVRDFRDVIMSKIYRGQPGKDCNQIADDATEEGCIKDIKWMLNCLQEIKKHTKVFISKMEDLLLDTENQCKKICTFIEIPYEDSIKDFHLRTKLETKRERYKNKVDLSQISLWKRKDEIYEGFFKDKNLSHLFSFAKEVNKQFDYE